MRLRRASTGPLRVGRILVATDRSETAELAVAFAADMAGRYEAELVLLRVLLTDDGVLAETSRDLAEQADGLAGERGRSSVVVHDDPAEAIVDAAKREQADVVVVGSVGMSGRKEFLLRNVPNRVSHNAPCTVVIVQTHEAA
jgi:nucleotide-binding universal stress UspA family protein